MTLATIIMVVLICLGCVLGMAGVAVAGYQGYRTYKAARAVGITSRRDLDEISLQAERLQSLSATTSELRYLKDEVDRSTGYLSKLKS